MSVAWLLSNKTPAKLLYAELDAFTVIWLKLLQNKSALPPMLLTPLPIVMLVRLEQPMKAVPR